ncbi:MAG TPA: hypothetical protein VNS46_06235 [Nocardioides sp.]|nr:hypothetical protein [Nocardioides sp.]
MPDPIDDLSRFSQGFEGGDMPLSAAEVRRRGDRIRRRRNALVAGGAALAVGVVAVPVLALTGGGGDVDSDRDRIADGSKVVTLSEQDLLTDDDTEYTPGAADWFTTATYEGDGQSAFHPCAREGLTGLGAQAVWQRDFEMRNLLPDAPVEVVGGASFNEATAEFATEADARAAYDTVADWVVDCEGRIAGTDSYRVPQDPRPVDLQTAGEAVLIDAQWGPAPEEIDPFGDAAFINETGLVLIGKRLAVLTHTTVGQDYNFTDEEGGTPLERMIPRAAARLLPGDAVPTPAESDAPDDRSGAVSLGDGDQLLLEMAANDDGEPVRAEPAAAGVGRLELCGVVLDPGALAVERLAANASGPEYGEAREVLVLPSAEDADALAASIADTARDCPTQDVSGTTWRHRVTTREDQPLRTAVITRTYETDGQPQLGTETWVVSHQGPLVLLVASSGEGSPTPADVDRSTDELLQRLRGTMEWVLALSES